MLDKLSAIEEKYYYLEEQLSDPEVVADMKRYKKISKEYKDLKAIVDVYRHYKDVLGNLETAKEMITSPDEEMRMMAMEELEALNAEKNDLDEKIKIMLLPKDPDDNKDVIFEIRSGTGGDEASLFVGDLYRMYMKFFETKGWKVEHITMNEGTVGGYNKVVLEISGEEIYGNLKFESGGHRVQRVPKTESQGRVHTSAVTVAVMPKLEMEDVNINKADLRRDTFRSSGAGGQHVNKTESGVRYTHIPTGIVAESTDGRSQHKNKEIALQRLYLKIQEVQRARHEDQVASERRGLVGSGDRSSKVRTYNFPQNRLTDHRINLTLYSLDKVMEGNIGDIIEALRVADTAEKMRSITQ